MNDKFLHNHRQQPPESFGRTLYQQISNDEVIDPPQVKPQLKLATQRRQWLRIATGAVAALLVIAVVGIVTLQSHNHTAQNQLTQIDTGVLLDDLPPITTDNAGQLINVAQLGTGRASGIVYSPDGETLAIGTPDGIALYEGGLDATPRLLRTAQNSSYTRALAFSPDGTHIAMIDGSDVRIWDVASGAQTALLESDDANFAYGVLDYSADGRLIAAGGGIYDPAHMDLYVWDAQTGERVGAVSEDGDDVRAIAFSPDSQSLAVVAKRGVYLYTPDLTSKTTLSIPPDSEGNGIAFSPDGSLLAVGRAKAVALWDVATDSVYDSIPVNLDAIGPFIMEVEFNDDGSLLAIVSQNFDVSVWDMKAETFTIPPEQIAAFQDIGNIAFKPNSDVFSYINYGTTVITRDGRTGEILNEIARWDGSSVGISITPDTQSIITYGFDGMIRFYDTQTGEITRTVDTGLMYIYNALVSSPDGRYLAYGGYDYETVSASLRLVSGGITLLDLQGDSDPVSYGEGNDMLTPFTMANDGSIIAYDHHSARTVYWDLGAPEQKWTLSSVYMPSVYRMAINPDESLLATVSSQDQKLHVYDIASSSEITPEIPNIQKFQAVGFSPDGTRLAASSYDGDDSTVTTLTVWDVETWTPIYQHDLESPAGVIGFAYSPDGSLIAAESVDSLTILDAETGDVPFETVKQNSASYAAAFSPDGRYLATAGQDGIIRLWGVLPD